MAFIEEYYTLHIVFMMCHKWINTVHYNVLERNSLNSSLAIVYSFMHVNNCIIEASLFLLFSVNNCNY